MIIVYSYRKFYNCFKERLLSKNEDYVGVKNFIHRSKDNFKLLISDVNILSEQLYEFSGGINRFEMDQPDELIIVLGVLKLL